MKILLDMNLSRTWIGYLHSSGIEAVHWADIGAGDAHDTQIMDYARVHEFVVLTQDLDFGAILAATRGVKPSVVQIRSDDLAPAVIGPNVLLALMRFAHELEHGALVTVDPNRIRGSILPLRID